MLADDIGALQAFRLLPPWLDSHGLNAKYPGIASYSGALDAAVVELTASAAEQDGHNRSAKGATADSKRIRKDLVSKDMQHVAAIARLAIPDVVAMSVELQMPKFGIDRQRLLNAAGAMATKAEQYHDVLVKQGLAEEYFVRLRNNAAALKQAIDAHGKSVALRRGATESIAAEVGRARKLVAMLSVLVEQVLADDPKTLAEWKKLKRATVRGVHRVATVAPETPAKQETPATQETPAAQETAAKEETPAKVEKAA
jgi:hypothetical protein